MGAFGAGLVQGAQDAVAMKSQREQIEMQKKYYDTLGKKMDLELQMAQRQIQGQQDLVKNLFRPPQTMNVAAQGPGAPVPLPLGEADQFLQTLSPQDMAQGRSMQEIQERGPGFYKEGPQPTGKAEVPGTGGMLASASPQLQAVFQSMMDATGGDMNKTMSTLAMLAPKAFPQKPVDFELGPGQGRFRQVGDTITPLAMMPAKDNLMTVSPGSTVLNPATGQPVFTAPDKPEKAPGLMNVAPGSTVFDPVTMQPAFTAPDRPEKPPAPKIEGVDTPEGKQFVQVSPQGVQPIGQPIKTAPGAPKAVDTENAIAMEMFGTDYSSLAQPARAEVNKRIQQDKLDLYKAQADVMVAAAGERERVKQSIPEKPSGPEREKLLAGVNSLDQLNTVAQLYDPSLVGPSVGAMSELRASLPEKWGGLSAKQAQLYAALATFKNRLTNLISGAAVSPDEAARLAAEMPQPGQEPQVFEQRWVNSYRNVQMLEERRRQILAGTGVDITGAPALPTPHKRFSNSFTENIFPSTVTGPPQAGVKKPDDPKTAPAPTEEDPRVSQLGRHGREQYDMAPDKAGFLDRYFKAMEGRRVAKQ